MSYRHHFIAGSIVSPLISKNYWKNFGEINFIATGTNNSVENNLHGISNSGDILFSCKLPLESKLLAVHNTHPEVVIESKNEPGKLNVLDCETQTLITEIRCKKTRTFTGNAVYSKDGSKLFTVEIDKKRRNGFLTCWEKKSGYSKLHEYSSGGLNPVQILRLPDSDILTVANAGDLDIHTRSQHTTPVPKLSNLTFMSEEGDNLETMLLDYKYRSNSISSMNVRADGLIVFAAHATNGSQIYSTLVGVHRVGDSTTIINRSLKEYSQKIKKIIFIPNAPEIALITDCSNQIEIHSLFDGSLKRVKLPNVCDIASDSLVTIATTDNGKLCIISQFNEIVTQSQLFLEDHIIFTP